MSDVLDRIPGLAGYLAMEQQRRQGAMQNLQATSGIMNVLRQQEEAQRQAQMAPLQMEALRAQVQGQQAQAAERQQGQAFQQALPQLLDQTTGEDGSVDYGKLSGLLFRTPGGAKMAMDLRKAEEDRAARIQVTQESLAEKARAAQQRHELQMQNAKNQAERDAATAEYRNGMMSLRQEMLALRRSGSGGGDARREPFKFSVNGQNVQGWRDRVGNVYGPDGMAVAGYQPEISSADQSAEQKRVSEQDTVSTVNDMLGRIERIASANPRTVAGVGAPISNAVTWLANQTAGNVQERYARAPNEQAVQIRDSMISSLGGLGRLSNQDRQRIEDVWKLGISGNAQAVQDAIQLTRQIVNSKYAGSSAPVARGQPSNAPAVGTVQGGYRFKGGNPADQSSWEKVP